MNAAQEKLVNAACSEDGSVLVGQGGVSAKSDPDAEPVSLGYAYLYGSYPLADSAYELFLQTNHFHANSGKTKVSAFVSVRAQDGTLVNLAGGKGIKAALESYEELKAKIDALDAEKAAKDGADADGDTESGE